METQGYQCNACGAGFEDAVPEACSRPEIKCPRCGSRDIHPSDEMLELLELIEEMGRTGG